MFLLLITFVGGIVLENRLNVVDKVLDIFTKK